ncbi:MAG: fibronectin type III domain-containing protein, partial [Bacteroides sp.]|nr:fibronectin type III domain-containing protein [Bacteroides sp.]
MKKFLSLLLSIVMLLSVTAGIDLSAYADNRIYDLLYETEQAGQLCNSTVFYKFSMSSYGTLNIDYDSVGEYYDYTQDIFVIKEKDLDDYNIGKNVDKYFNVTTSKSGRGNFWYDGNVSLYPGDYYLCIYIYGVTVDYNLIVTPTVSKSSTLKVSSCNTTSLKLSWNKVAGVNGYQLQRKSGNSYKNVANTASTSYTVKNLKAGTSYKFRVRAYNTVNGKKYYSSWTTLTTPTKPSKPSIKSPSTNKKHQITAKWKKVGNCSGYQVQYSKKKNFSSVIATKTVSGSSKTSYTGKNFT